MQVFRWACFLHPENQVFTYQAYIIDYLYARPHQIDFLFSITCTHAKKLGGLNLFIEKLARLSILFIIGEKEHFSYISILKNN